MSSDFMPRARRGRTVMLWAGTNVLLGIISAYPLLLLLIVAVHLRAQLFDRPDSPFMPKEVEGGEASAVIAATLMVVLPLLIVVVLANWAMIRRLRLRWGGWLVMVVLTLAVLVTPAFLLERLW